MKLTLRIFLVIAMFSSIALADGNMGGGGFTDDGNMGGGGKTCANCQIIDQTNKKVQETDGFLEYLQDFLTKIFG